MKERKILTKTERVVARNRIENYHQIKLLELLEPIRQALSECDTGKMDVFELEKIIHIHHRQAQELWSFINRYYELNSALPILLAMIDKEEKGEWHWEPKSAKKKLGVMIGSRPECPVSQETGEN